MPQTYRAILNGSHVTWLDPVPELLPATEVEIVLLDKAARTASIDRGAKMAQALQSLADRSTFDSINPVAWQQEIREDRVLPGREV